MWMLRMSIGTILAIWQQNRRAIWDAREASKEINVVIMIISHQYCVLVYPAYRGTATKAMPEASEKIFFGVVDQHTANTMA
jgi:hypothetical protein